MSDVKREQLELFKKRQRNKIVINLNDEDEKMGANWLSSKPSGVAKAAEDIRRIKEKRKAEREDKRPVEPNRRK